MFHTKIMSPCDLTKHYKRTRISSVPSSLCIIELRTGWDNDNLGLRSPCHSVPLFCCSNRGRMDSETCGVDGEHRIWCSLLLSVQKMEF